MWTTIDKTMRTISGMAAWSFYAGVYLFFLCCFVALLCTPPGAVMGLHCAVRESITGIQNLPCFWTPGIPIGLVMDVLIAWIMYQDVISKYVSKKVEEEKTYHLKSQTKKLEAGQLSIPSNEVGKLSQVNHTSTHDNAF